VGGRAPKRYSVTVEARKLIKQMKKKVYGIQE
jgi:hypothetical protein